MCVTSVSRRGGVLFYPISTQPLPHPKRNPSHMVAVAWVGQTIEAEFILHETSRPGGRFFAGYDSSRDIRTVENLPPPSDSILASPPSCSVDCVVNDVCVCGLNYGTEPTSSYRQRTIHSRARPSS